MGEVVVLKPIKTERQPEPAPLPPDLPDFSIENGSWQDTTPTLWQLLRAWLGRREQ